MAARGGLNFRQEAQQSLEEVAYAIAEGKISDTLPCGPGCVHLNLTTLEGQRYCLRLSMRGFEVRLQASVGLGFYLRLLLFRISQGA